MNVLPKIAIFDCDGVISDTATLHFDAWKKAVKDKMHLEFDNLDEDDFRGVGRIESLELILKSNNIDYSNINMNEICDYKNKVYRNCLKDGKKIVIFKETIEIIQKLKSENVKIALASVSNNSKTILQTANIIEYFDYICDPDTIKNLKPDPEIFLKPMNYFGFLPSECWAFEDAVVGVKAIKSANQFCIGIGGSKLEQWADKLFDNCSELNYNKCVETYNVWYQKINFK